MTFCQIFEVASRVRQKVVDHRSLTIEKLSVQEKKVVGDKRSLVAGSLMTGSTVVYLLALQRNDNIYIAPFLALSLQSGLNSFSY